MGTGFGSGLGGGGTGLGGGGAGSGSGATNTPTTLGGVMTGSLTLSCCAAQSKPSMCNSTTPAKVTVLLTVCVLSLSGALIGTDMVFNVVFIGSIVFSLLPPWQSSKFCAPRICNRKDALACGGWLVREGLSERGRPTGEDANCCEEGD